MRSALVVVMVGTSVAAAKPLPAGLTITVKTNHLFASRAGITVPLFDSDDDHATRSYQTLRSAELSDDGKGLVLHADGCVDSVEDAIEIPHGAIEARLENVVGMQFHLKKKYPEAIAHFTTASQTDPATPVYATNLLSAQSMSGKLADADATLATYGAKNVAWFAWRLAVDSDLDKLRGRPSAKPFAAPRPTKLVFHDTDVAYSPLGLVAVGEHLLVGMGSPDISDLVIYDVKQNRRLLRLPLVAEADACFEPNQDMRRPAARRRDDVHEDPSVRAHRRQRAGLLNALLDGLGFDKVATMSEFLSDPATTLTSPDKQLSLAVTDDTLTLTHGKAIAKLATAHQAVHWLAWSSKVVVVRFRASYSCGGADSQQTVSDVIAVP